MSGGFLFCFQDYLKFMLRKVRAKRDWSQHSNPLAKLKWHRLAKPGSARIIQWNALKWEFCLLRKSAQDGGEWRCAVRAPQSSQVHFRGDKPKHLNITRKDRARGSTLGTQNPLRLQQDVAPEALQSPTGGKNFHRENFWAGLGEVQRQSLN